MWPLLKAGNRSLDVARQRIEAAGSGRAGAVAERGQVDLRSARAKVMQSSILILRYSLRHLTCAIARDLES